MIVAAPQKETPAGGPGQGAGARELATPNATPTGAETATPPAPQRSADEVRAYALRYAALGWPVLPLRPNDKQPATEHGVKDATTDPERIAAMFSRDGLNLGIATTAVWALDIDVGKGGPESLAALEAAHGALPDTLEARTRNGGRHLVFRHPEGRRIGCRTNVCPGVDIRGDGGYIAAEPSAVPPDPGIAGAGGYAWLDWDVLSGEPPEIAEAPEWLVDLVAGKPTAAPAAAPQGGGERMVTQGGRNDYLSRRAFALRKAGAAPAEILAALRRINASECEPPLADDEVARIAQGKAGIPPDALEVEPKEPPLRLVTVEGLEAAELAPPQFWIDGILPAKAVTLLSGHGGTGKSTLALSMAAHLALGLPWAGLQTRRARVGFVTLEDEAQIVLYRLRTICETLRLPCGALADSLVIFDGTAAGEPLVQEVSDFGTRTLAPTAAMQQLQHVVEAPEVWIVDNASDAFDANENERRLVRRFMRHHLTQLVKQTGGAVLLLVHLPKEAAKAGGSESYSGSTAWHNSARSRLALSKDGDGVKLEHQKSNYGPCIAPLRFAWAEGSGVLVHAASAPADAESAPHVSHDDEVLRAIEEAAAQGAHVPTATAGARTGPAVICEILSGAGHRLSRRDVSAALIRLEHHGRIRRAEITTPARHRREVWESAPNALNALNAPNAVFSATGATGASARAECAEWRAGVIGGMRARNSARNSARQGC